MIEFRSWIEEGPAPAVFAALMIAMGGVVRPALGQVADAAANQESPVLRADGPLSAQADLGETLGAADSDALPQTHEGDGAFQDARPYTLESAVSIALRNNRQLAVSQYDLDVANKQVSEAYGALFPEIDGFASMQRNLEIPSAFLPRIFIDPDADPDDLIAVTFGADNQWNAGLTLNQALFDAGVFVGVGTAGSFRNLAREALRGSAQGVATTTRIAYLNVLLAQEAVRVTQNSIERVRQTLEETRALNRAGLASDYDVLRLEVQLANIEPNLRRAQNEVDEARRVLAIEMGLGEMASAAAFGELHQIDLSEGAVNTEDNVALLVFAGVPEAAMAGYDDLESVALSNRTDLQQARLQRDLEEARVKYERTQLFPTLSGFFTWGLQAQENGALNFFGENPDQRFTTSAVGVQIDVPLFSGTRRWNRVEQRKIGVRQAEERIGDLRQRAANEVETVLSNLTESRSRAEAQRQAVTQAQRGFDIVTTEYLAGTQPRLEVTEAELALRQAEQNYALAIYDYLVAQAQLDLAVGVVPAVDPAVEAMIEGDIRPENRLNPDSAGDRVSNDDREGDR
ncbi:MAG: TolC family protein [Gemmatimonadetes bacterium]|nr:TolC family protein [Gemmatimonadota bacterium]